VETEHFKTGDPWVGEMHCPECGHVVKSWMSSGMSQCCPHFYCDTCSNALVRDADKQIAWRGKPSKAMVKRIEATLPGCTCGGQFRPGTSPKCPKCGFEFAHQDGVVKRLTDPHVILIDGAVMFDDDGPSYRVRIR
jgi:hypothetical protein